MGSGAVLTVVSCRDDARSAQVEQVAEQVVTANRRTGLRRETLDIDDEPERAVQLGLLESPALILWCDGVERGRLSGVTSRRAVLHLLLPELYRDPDQALTELRNQLDSPGEQFPRRALKRHERIGKAARVQMLRSVRLFESLSKRDVTRVAAGATEVVVDAGGTVTREGEAGDSCWIVAAGALTVRRKGRRMAALGPGDVVGEMALIDGGPRTATVIADERCVLVALDRDTFRATLRSAPDLAIAMLEVMSRRLRAADAQLVD